MRLSFSLSIVLVGLLAGCASTDIDSAIEEMPDLEASIAKLDGKTDPQPYKQVLDAIQSKCLEQNRTALFGLSRSLAKANNQILDESEENIDHLAALKDLYSEAVTFADANESDRTSCMDIVIIRKNDAKEIAADEAEQAEYDKVMNAGEP